ncbi:MAG TPA: efflux RND transporter periplasmic adaptor subunit [Aquella sp.]|nr:efflux RND transporter periplasmic adaptor subunit [Aquella sp.]
MRKVCAFKAVTTTAIAVVMLAGCGGKNKAIKLPPHHVDVAVVSPYNVPYNFDYPGSVQGLADFPVIPRVSGTIFRQVYTEGTMVKKDQVLYEIDKRPFYNQLAADQGQLHKDNAAMVEYKVILDRYIRLLKINAVSQQDVNTATINYEGAVGMVQTDQANIAQDKLNIEYCEVRSPVDGLIAERQVTIGAMVTAFQTILTYINSKNSLYILFSVPENDRLVLQRGVTSGKISVPKGSKFDMALQLADGGIMEKAGLVNFFDTRISLQNGTWNMRGDINNEKLSTKLLSGQFVHVYLTGAKFVNTFAIPQAAVFRDNKGAFVYILGPNNKIEKRTVNPGMMADVLWVINSGLKTGDKVVVDGGMKVKEGEQVVVDNTVDQTKSTAPAAA